jgi:signal transduction histidine kinase
LWLLTLSLTLGLFTRAVIYNYNNRVLDASRLFRSGLEQLNLTPQFYAIYFTILESALVIVFLITAGIIFWRRQDTWIALVMSLGLMTFGATQGPSFMILAGGVSAWRIPVAALWMLRSLFSLLIFYLFPSGRFVPRWVRWLLVPYTLWEAAHVFIVFIVMEPGPARFQMHEMMLIGTLVFYITGLAVQIYRYRAVSNSIERQQTKWVVAGFAVALVGNGVFLALELAVMPTLMPNDNLTQLMYRMAGNLILIYIPVTLAPIFVAVAILRHRLWDIDIVINRALVYSTLTAIVASIYMLIIGLLSVLFQTSGSLFISMVATAVVAVMFQPLRERLQRAVNNLLYGERDDPYAVISHLGERLQGALSPQNLLSEIAETVAQALKLPYVSIAIRHGDEFEVVATYGTRGREPLVLPLAHQGEVIGRMLIEPGNRDEPFIRADWRLLSDVARHAGIGVHIVLLTYDLQRSRQNLVTAREEERRRLRRDLHDGLGPTLASMILKLDAAQNVLTRDPKSAEAMLHDLRSQSQSVLTDVRRIAYELRPPVLDELGITEALREHLNRLYLDGDTRDNALCGITLDAPEHRLILPAAVEVAVYRIATEAVTNVIRHAEACQCQIRLWVQETQFCLEILDDGKGISESVRRGVGFNSMRERAAELNGTFTIESEPGHGTRIQVSLPL